MRFATVSIYATLEMVGGTYLSWLLKFEVKGKIKNGASF